MAKSEAQRRADAMQASIRYERKSIKRIPLNVPQSFYNSMRTFLDNHMDGIETNTYIKNALMNQLLNDGYSGESVFKDRKRKSS